MARQAVFIPLDVGWGVGFMRLVSRLRRALAMTAVLLGLLAGLGVASAQADAPAPAGSGPHVAEQTPAGAGGGGGRAGPPGPPAPAAGGRAGQGPGGGGAAPPGWFVGAGKK